MTPEPFDPAPWVAAYRQMHVAMVAGDTDTLRSLLAPEFELVHMTGYVQPAAEWLQHIESGRMRYFASAEASVAVQGSDARRWLRGRSRVRADIWGASGTWPLQMDIDFRLQQGRWRMTRATASTY